MSPHAWQRQYVSSPIDLLVVVTRLSWQNGQAIGASSVTRILSSEAPPRGSELKLTTATLPGGRRLSRRRRRARRAPAQLPSARSSLPRGRHRLAASSRPSAAAHEARTP